MESSHELVELFRQSQDQQRYVRRCSRDDRARFEQYARMNDENRSKRVETLMRHRMLRTGRDFYRAAALLLRGNHATHYATAYLLAVHALELGCRSCDGVSTAYVVGEAHRKWRDALGLPGWRREGEVRDGVVK